MPSAFKAIADKFYSDQINEALEKEVCTCGGKFRVWLEEKLWYNETDLFVYCVNCKKIYNYVLLPFHVNMPKSAESVTNE